MNTYGVGDPAHEVMGKSYPALSGLAGTEGEDKTSPGRIVFCYLPSRDGFDAVYFTPTGNAFYVNHAMIDGVDEWLDFARRHYYWITKDADSTPFDDLKGRKVANSKKPIESLAEIDFGEFMDIAESTIAAA